MTRTLLALLLGVALLAGPAGATSPHLQFQQGQEEVREVRRLAGPSRFETAAAISSDSFAPGVRRVWVATGESFADALAAGAAAAGDEGPVLTTAAGSLPAATRAELVRLRPAQVAVVGGTAAVSDSVRDAIAAALPEADVTRVSGADRFATAGAVAATGFPDGSGTVYVATGGTFPDALAAVPAAGADGAALLLVTRDAVPAPTRTALADLDPQRIVVVGGTGAISPAVADELRRGTGAQISRVSGADRFATAAALAARTGATPGRELIVASGETFPDALAGGPAAAAAGTAILLTARTRLPAATAEAIRRLDPVRVTILGGEGAVAGAVVTSIRTGEEPDVLSLRGDGLGDQLPFGTPMDVAEQRLVGLLGQPGNDTGFVVACEFAGPERARYLVWDGITVEFRDQADPRLTSVQYFPDEGGRDVYGLRTPVGIGLGTPSAQVGERYGSRARFFPSDSNPFGSFWSVEPAEGGTLVIFVEDDSAAAPVDYIGANVQFCE